MFFLIFSVFCSNDIRNFSKGGEITLWSYICCSGLCWARYVLSFQPFQKYLLLIEFLKQRGEIKVSDLGSHQHTTQHHYRSEELFHSCILSDLGSKPKSTTGHQHHKSICILKPGFWILDHLNSQFYYDEHGHLFGELFNVLEELMSNLLCRRLTRLGHSSGV